MGITGFSTRRRTLAAAAALAAGLAAAPLPALAADAGRLTLIAPARPGGGWDQTARAMAEDMQEAGIASAVTVENIAGAGGTVGLAQFADRNEGEADALLVTGLVMVGAVLTNQSPVALTDTTPIARLTGEYEVVVVPAASEIKTFKDLVDRLKADPGAVAWGGGSAGGTDHILAGLIAEAAGVDPAKVNYVPFSGGGEALAAILGGHVTAGVSGLGEWVGQIQAGELRALAISSPERLEGVDVPTIAEQGLAIDLQNWRGVMAPPGLDAEEQKALLGAVDSMVKSDAWKKTLQERGWIDTYLAGEPFAVFLQSEQERVTTILKRIGLVQ